MYQVGCFLLFRQISPIPTSIVYIYKGIDSNELKLSTQFFSQRFLKKKFLNSNYRKEIYVEEITEKDQGIPNSVNWNPFLYCIII